MFLVDMDITGIAIPELSLSTYRSGLWSGRKPVQSGIFQNTPDTVPFQIRQEMPHDKSGGIEKLSGYVAVIPSFIMRRG